MDKSFILLKLKGNNTNNYQANNIITLLLDINKFLCETKLKTVSVWPLSSLKQTPSSILHDSLPSLDRIFFLCHGNR